MSDPEMPGFQVVDRRRTASEETSPNLIADEPDVVSVHEETGAHTSQSADTVDTERHTEDVGSERSSMPDPAFLLSMAALQMNAQSLAKALLPVFDGHAWRAMGFVGDPRTGETSQDLSDAKLAIDCVQFLMGKIEGTLEDSERREIHRRLNDLRMNYLAKLQGT